jgi:hypothetical protein
VVWYEEFYDALACNVHPSAIERLSASMEFVGSLRLDDHVLHTTSRWQQELIEHFSATDEQEEERRAILQRFIQALEMLNKALLCTTSTVPQPTDTQ